MKKEKLSHAIGEVKSSYIAEAAKFSKDRGRRRFSLRTAGGVVTAAAVLLCIVLTVIFLNPIHSLSVTVYAYGTDEEIGSAGAVMNTGTITDSGVMKGHPVQFYLSGEDIASVRFSCKNQFINYMDWTEKREEFGISRNFTVPYGEDESEYYYLLIEWVPENTIRALTDNAGIKITDLEEELREDMIVMQITFTNGTTVTKAVTIRLLDDGTFAAACSDYVIQKEDDFVNRPDSKPVRRELLYGIGESGEKAEEEEKLPKIKEDVLEEAGKAAKEYYNGTVFEVVTMELLDYEGSQIRFTVCVRKGGKIQEPDRTITLEQNEEGWEVKNEGY